MPGELKLLVVEDDNAVRALASRILLAEGHAVLGVHTLGEAREALERGDDFDLVIADVMLPDGKAGALASLLTGNRLLLTSGYDLSDLMASGDVRDVESFLPKPYTPRQLLGKVRSVLARFEGRM
ncbi:MAG: response regulator [Gemmatimonadota bacterium]